MPSMNADMLRPTGGDPVDTRIARLEAVGTGVLRYGIVFLLVAIGAAKYFAFEAEAIRPLVENSPFLSWMIGAFGVPGASRITGTLEIATGLAIASRPFAPTVSAVGSGAGVATFLTTLSFLFSTPGALSLEHPASGFLMKDVVLLGACLLTAAEALKAARARAATGAERRIPSVSAAKVA
jgi:reactive chlorine resistance protein C